MQTPHPACVKINLLEGGDLCVFDNHGNCNGHATEAGYTRFNKGISLHGVRVTRLWTSVSHVALGSHVELLSSGSYRHDLK